MSPTLMSPTSALFLDQVFKLLVTAIFPLIYFLIARYIRDGKTKDALEQLSSQALIVVQRLNKRRRQLKDPNRPGSWTTEEAEELRRAAREEIYAALGPAMDVLLQNMGSEQRLDQTTNRIIDAHAESTRIPQATIALAERLSEEPKASSPKTEAAEPGEPPSLAP